MKGSEVVRRAHELIKAGWVTGWHCADAAGAAVRTMTEDRKPNPAAVRFSIYGALSKVLLMERAEDPALLWEVLTRRAIELRTDRDNPHIHPVISLNDRQGQTVEGVLEFLEDCMERLKHREAANDNLAAGGPM